MDIISLVDIKGSFVALMLGFGLGFLVCYVILSKALVNAAKIPLINENRLLKAQVISLKGEIAAQKLFMLNLLQRLRKK